MRLATRWFGQGWWLLGLLVLLNSVLLAPAHGRGTSPPDLASIPSVSPAQLPPEARQTLDLIRKGGPFPHQRDGITFNNFERELPLRSRGYYREYTVATPGLSHRGARRIVTGSSGELYYTDDHYRTFKRIRE